VGPFFEPRNGDGSWAPLFPLLHGLSFSRFAFSALAADPPGPLPLAAWAPQDVVVTLGINVTNAGAAGGKVVVAAFFALRVPRVIRYVRTLASFAKVDVAAGASARVALPVRRIDIDRWDPGVQDWVVDRGVYTFFVGDCFSSGGLYANEEPCAQQQLAFEIA
jgi:hypothetical protein